MVIALVVTTDGLPLAYRELPGNTADCTTIRMFLARACPCEAQRKRGIEQQYGRARRVWVMDRGIPTEAVLAEMRGSDPPVQYLVETLKGRLPRREKDLLAKPWQQAREGGGQTAVRGQRTLCRSLSSGGPLARPVGRECRSRQQGTHDAQAADEVVVEAAA